MLKKMIVFDFLNSKKVPFRTYNEVMEDDLKDFLGVNAQADELLDRLRRCKAGKEMWREYQTLIIDIFTYLFSPPLTFPKVQNRTVDGLEIRDAIFPNHVFQGFWHEIRLEYKVPTSSLRQKIRLSLTKEMFSRCQAI